MCVEPSLSVDSSTTTFLPFQEIPLFRNVRADQLMAAVNRCDLLPLVPGRVLLTPGQSNEDIFIILAGTVTVHLGAEGSRGNGMAIPIGQCI